MADAACSRSLPDRKNPGVFSLHGCLRVETPAAMSSPRRTIGACRPGASWRSAAANGENVSYEEYHPYGTTAWWTDPGSTVSQKRYRYTGMERDEESGLSLHGIRYYAAWIGRWTSRDRVSSEPAYAYARCNPVRLNDTSGNAPPDDPAENKLEVELRKRAPPSSTTEALDRSARELIIARTRQGLDPFGVVPGTVADSEAWAQSNEAFGRFNRSLDSHLSGPPSYKETAFLSSDAVGRKIVAHYLAGSGTPLHIGGQEARDLVEQDTILAPVLDLFLDDLVAREHIRRAESGADTSSFSFSAGVSFAGEFTQGQTLSGAHQLGGSNKYVNDVIASGTFYVSTDAAT